MKLFFAVVVDLAEFVWGFLRPKKSETKLLELSPGVDKNQEPVRLETVKLLETEKNSSATNPKLLPAVSQNKEDDLAATPISLLPETEKSPVVNNPIGYQVTAFCIDDATRVLQRPLLAFDTMVGVLPYGTKVNLLTYEGRFALIEHSTVSGWVPKDNLVLKAEDIYPTFRHGECYLSDHSETVKMRRCTKDEFLGQELFLPLQSNELVSYRLKEAGLTLPGTTERPRLPGRWHELWRGKRGVVMGLSPRTGAVMEGYNDTYEPFLAYVKAVAPTETITIETVGLTEDGVYEELVWPKSKWVEYRPVFISFS